MKYAVGKQPIFGFGECGKNQTYVVAARPYEYFSFRWVPDSKHFLGDVLSVANTLVVFHIKAESDQSCKVTLIESGFSSLPVEQIEHSLKNNSCGWDFMLNRLTKYFD